MKDMDLPTVMTYLKKLAEKLKRQEGTIPTVKAIETAVDLLSTHIPLKSCPFCGGEPEVRFSVVLEALNKPYKEKCFVGCKCCGVRTLDSDDVSAAVTDWNRRINDDHRAVNPEDG